jgi:hypothetical protein
MKNLVMVNQQCIKRQKWSNKSRKSFISSKLVKDASEKARRHFKRREINDHICSLTYSIPPREG